MAINKRSKKSRQRGSWTHGWGEKKKHRGAGSRGGFGNAGSGKRADSNKPCFWHDRLYLSKQGFVSKTRTPHTFAINIGMLDQLLKRLVSEKKVEEKNGVYEIDGEKIGFNKLLSTGYTDKKMIIKIDQASPKAVEKIQEAGGNVILAEKKPAPIKKEVKAK
jgi:large subunit ribosomal protein L15